VNLRNLSLKKAYSSDFDDILEDFYIPALTLSLEYQRLAGYFSSTSLAVAARGIMGIIKNGGAMKLIVSPRLSKDDLDAILSSRKDYEEIIENRLILELDQLEDEFIKDHVAALGWMVANKRLHIKVAVVYDDNGEPLPCEDVEQTTLFHQKVGILRDTDGNTLSFSGSINETAAGWLENIEEFKVFRDWESSEKEYVQADIIKFNRFWANQSKRIRVIDIPRAIEEKLIDIAPSDIENIDLEKYYKKSKNINRVELFSHQKDAVNAWLSNDMKGIFAMATGTGKTYAALGCLEKASKIFNRLLVVISCPYQHLIQQWRREITNFGVKYDELIIADSTNRRWRDVLVNSILDISLGHKEKVLVLTTHSTFASDDFVSIIQGYKSEFTILIIADEVHGLGAKESRKGLIDEYDLRLGLSATPRRWFDFPGTNLIYDFFKGEVFQFSLEDAINTINPATGKTYLVPYRYLPRFAYLSTDEIEQYAAKTKRIAKIARKASVDEEMNKCLELLLYARADIIKNAYEKYIVLERILDEIPNPIKWTIIYSSPQQIDTIMKIVNTRRIIAHRFTMEEGTTPIREYNNLSERDFLLKEFGEGNYQVLVAMKCLDEGVDVPPARISVLMASSGNPREHIQRIGRILRRYPGKNEASIFDIIVLPQVNDVPPDLREIERRIIRKELSRYEEIARVAINNAEALAIISENLYSIVE